MNMKAIAVGEFEVNCWVLSDDNRRAIVVDPGANPEKIAAYIKKQQLSVDGYLITHGHMDHISALASLCKEYPAPIRIHPSDASWAFSAANQMPPYYDVPTPPTQNLLHADLSESKHNQCAGFTFDIIETPGHSPGSVCLYFPTLAALFSGDTILSGTVGRTDFPGGSAASLQQSLQRIKQLPPKTMIYPGHGSPTKLETELQHNPFLQP